MSNPSTSTRRNDLLAGIVAGVLIAHAALIYTLHGMPLFFDGTSHSESSVGDGDGINDFKHREEQLFQTIQALNNAKPTHKSPELSLSEASIPLPDQPLSAIANPLAAAFDGLQHQIDDSLQERDGALSTLETIQFIADDTFTKETDAILGSIEMPRPDEVDSFRHVAIGVKEGQKESSFHRHLEKQIAYADVQAEKSVGELAQIQQGSNFQTNGGGGAIAGSNHFTAKMEYTPASQGGYLFRIVLSPKEGVVFKRIVHNLFFLIDRSQSISPQRYASAKAAVIQALKHLNPNDTFNIFVFDSKVVGLAPQSLPYNRDSIERAMEFLSEQPHGGPGASTDLYASLNRIIPDVVAENEVNSAILLSDGDTYLSQSSQRKNIATWTQQNAGKVSLYCLASGSGNNIALLDLLATINRGSLTYSPQDEGNANALQNLVYSIHNPIGKDIVLTAAASGVGSCITLYPPSHRLPNLHENLPYVVYGAANSLDDFTLFLQGRYYDNWLDIRQLISLKNAKQVPSDTLESDLARQRAYVLYENYLSNGNKSAKEDAKTLLHQYRLPIAFE